MIKRLYLTIDDAPSHHTVDKITYLKEHAIPAIFYVRGEFIQDHRDKIVFAIQNNFLIGNHSFTHPYFSKISIDQCIDEILRTEESIDHCYEKAKRKRPHKIIRFPFGDRGAGPCGKPPSTDEEMKKHKALQHFLKSEKFEHLSFQCKEDPCIDALWDIDVEDYKSEMIQNPKRYEEHLRKSFDSSHHTFLKSDVALLIHDFDHTHHLFEITMQFLKEKEVAFLEFDS